MPKQKAATKKKVLLITAESEESRFVRHRRLIRFPQLTMPLIAAFTPETWDVIHVDEIVQRINYHIDVDLVGITANTPAATHAYAVSQAFRARGIPTVIGGPHATLMADEAKGHCDAVVVGEGEAVWYMVGYSKGRWLSSSVAQFRKCWI